MVFNLLHLSDDTSVCNLYCTLFHLQFIDNLKICTLHPYTCFLYYCACIIIDIDSHMRKRYFRFSMLMLSFQSFWLCMLEKFLYLICEVLVPVSHIATQKASVGMYAIVTTILVCALFGRCHPYFFLQLLFTVHFHYGILW